MRVLELKPVVTQTMGKRKHKLRKQSKENKLCAGSDSSDEAALQGATAGQGCTHLNKSINFSVMKKSIKQHANLGECTSCSRDAAGGKNETCSTTPPPPSGAAPLAEAESLLDAAEQTIWVCLQCGHQGCDRNSKDQHALKHYQTPRSSSHAVTVNINTWSIWCYECDDEVFIDSSKKLIECVEFLRKQCGMGRPDSASGRPSSRAENPVQDSVESSTTIGEKPKLQQQKSVKQQTSSLVLPKVKGLSNLGNTCFFNAVMQNLSQTPGLEIVITDRNKKHLVETIPAATVEDSESEDESEMEEEDRKVSRLHLDTLEINLSESGALTQSLLNFLTDMNNPTKNSVISPNGLFGHVCRKAPRFKGFQQQDSHELLRHLLDGMKAEEVKRAQKGILKSFGLSENPNPKKLDDLTKKKIKEYGRLVKSTFVDTVFGGYFISTVLCEECRHPSQIYEPFLDISLPITEEKPLRPNSIWSSRKKDSSKPEASGSLGIATITTSKSAVEGFTDPPSEHMSKRAKRAAKKEARKKGKRGKSITEETAGNEMINEKNDNRTGDSLTKDGPVVNGDSHSNNDEEWDSKSDADVEDNVESDVVKSRCLNGVISEVATLAGEHKLIQKISQSKMTLINGVAFSANGVVVETTNRMSKSDSELCTQVTPGPSSGVKRADSTCDVDSLTTSISSMGISNDTSTLRSVSTEDVVNQRGGLVNGFDSDITLDDGVVPPAPSEVGSVKTQAAENGIDAASAAKSNTSALTNNDATTLPKQTKSRNERCLELKVKATSTLVPRYHPAGHECSVLSCLNQFSAMELLTGNNKFGCEKCTLRKHGKQKKEGKKETVYTNASKQVLIFSPPPVLTLHLKRFQQVGFSLRKVNRHVDFPLTLDLAPFCSSMAQGLRRGQTQVLYSLYGVVEHSGRLNNGHYTAYVKVRQKSEKIMNFISNRGTNGVKLHKLLEAMASVGGGHEGEDGKPEAVEGGSTPEAPCVGPGGAAQAGGIPEQREEAREDSGGSRAESPSTHPQSAPSPPPGRWFYISDSRVNEVSESAVLKSQAYILFYERIL